MVGVYDSRAIALSYWREEVDGKPRFSDPGFCSPEIAKRYWSQKINGKPRYVNSGKNETEGLEGGIMMHQQVFSYHDPVQALEHIANELPRVMEEAGVDVIASMWDKEKLAEYKVVGSGWDERDFVELNPERVVDITIQLVQLYNPSEGILEFARAKDKDNPSPLDTDWANAKE